MGVSGCTTDFWGCLARGKGTVEKFGDIGVVIHMSASDHQQPAVGSNPGYVTKVVLLLSLMTTLAN